MTRSATSVATFPGLAFVEAVVRAASHVTKAIKDRREVMNLAEFDDRMLKDIGLTRSDVEGALAEPLVRNPSLVLVRCANRHGRGERLVVPGRATRPVVQMVMTKKLCA
jgi:uncharacterized protein YjiS (DUF1127 family)